MQYCHQTLSTLYYSSTLLFYLSATATRTVKDAASFRFFLLNMMLLRLRTTGGSSIFYV